MTAIRTNAPPSVWLTTLGCAKNQVDSDKVEMMLTMAGYRMAQAPDDADVVMVNTCAFIEEARRESVETILEAQATRRPGARTVVIGCMAQRFGVEVERALPEVDAVLGLDRYSELVGTLDRLTGRAAPPSAWIEVPDPRRRPAMDILHLVDRPTPRTPYAYVKVAEGCDKPCTFCAIPLIRGRQRSRPTEQIRREIAGLVTGGVSEIVLVAQDLAAYGRDRDDGEGIEALVRSCASVDGLRRLRLLYLYPKEIRPGLIDEMAANPVVAPYFDLSLQHAARRLLRSMRRPGDAARHLDLIGRIRAADPDAALRSSFIVGFPGETEDDIEELVSFLEVARLDWAGFFPYSAEEGTPAASLEGHLAAGEIEERLRHVQSIQDQITAEAQARMIGRTVDVLVDGVEDGTPVGRSYREAPEIDGLVVLDAGTEGSWVRAEIVGAFGTDLEATVSV